METYTSTMISLNGCNYPLWKSRMEDLIYVMGFHQPVFCGEKPVGKTDEEWNLLHRQVCGYIRQWVDHNVLNHVSGEVNARTLWCKLEQLYAQKNGDSKLFLIKQLMGLRYCDGTPMLDHLNIFQGIVNRLSEMGITFDEKVQGLCLLGTLPDSWGTSGISLLNSAPAGVISMELVKDSLLNEEAKRNSTSQLQLNTVTKVTTFLDPYKQSRPWYRAEWATALDITNLAASNFKINPARLSEVQEEKEQQRKEKAEALDIPLPEMQGLKTLTVGFRHATKGEVVIHNIRLPIQSSVGDVINDLKTKVELSNRDAELRLLQLFSHKIYKIFPLNEKIEKISDQYSTLRAEEIPDEEKEKELGPQDRLIHVYHFTKNASQNQIQVQNFGEPFFHVIREGETLAEVKTRIQKKLQVPDEEFSKRREVNGAWEQYLGLEHSENTSKRSYAASQNENTSEKRVRIHN